MFDSVWLFDGEIHPECSGTAQTSECVDATLEEVWHLVTAEGFSRHGVLYLLEISPTLVCNMGLCIIGPRSYRLLSCRKCTSMGVAGAQTCISLGYHLLHLQIMRL